MVDNKDNLNCIEIETSVITIPVKRNGVEVGVFMFNPHDFAEAERHANIVDELEKQQKEYEEMAKKLDKDGTPKEVINFFACFIRDILKKIDNVYGEGTSNILFGSALDMTAVLSFFRQIKPYYEAASEERKQKAMNE